MSQSIVFPPRLREGDTVAVVAPSGPVNSDRMAASLPLLEARYQVRIAEDAFARDGYLAGSDSRRADELNRAFADPDVRAVFVARGGYGLMRILPLLDPAPLRADPKPIIGFSDATALLGWAWARAGLVSIHGPVVAQLAELPAADVEWLFDLLENPQPATSAARADREGQLWGGNLSLVAHLAGAPDFPPPPSDAIFFFEDVGERPYAIDRYLTSLAGRGVLSSAVGALVGDLTRCDETVGTDHPSARQVAQERLESLGLDVVFAGGFGHGTSNRALPMGGRVALDLAGGYVLLGGAVS